MVLTIVLGGCRSAAHNDVYIDKLAAEVRFLEDQLYQVDYENKVLREKLMRLKREEAANTQSRPKAFLDRAKPTERVEEKASTDDVEDVLGPIKTPRTDLGQPQVQPPKRETPDTDDSPEIQLPEIIPGDIRPPSDSQLTPPEIDTGNILPPGDARTSPALLPDKVVLPASLNQLFSEAKEIETSDDRTSMPTVSGEIASLVIDPIYSRGHDFEPNGESSGIVLVIKGLDDQGREIVIDASLEVAIMDPRREGAEARLGRWAFAQEQVRDAWQTAGTTDGVHLAIAWNDKHPLGDSVEVYCRTKLDDGEIVLAESTLDLSVRRSRAELWTPRGD